MMAGYFVLTLLVLIVDGVFGDEVKRVKEGDSVTLNSDVTKKQGDTVRWYYNNTLIAHINGGPSTSCLYDGEGGIFRDRLQVDNATGSLTITNIRSEHTGHYELEFIKSNTEGKSTSLNKDKDKDRDSKCDRTKITSKNTDQILQSFWLIVTDAEKQAFQRADDMIPGSAQSPVGKAGIFVVAVVAVAVALLV